jgi:glycerol-3-phosphate dehydrogenase
LSLSSKSFDLIVIGGGISGLGVALEAAYWGFDVLLLEKATCCSATSNNTLRIMHGGFRYLQSLNLSRVRQSIRAQAELLSLYPAHVTPLPCLMALEAVGLRSRWPVSAALKLFAFLASRETDSVRRGKIMPSDLVAREAPLLAPHANYGALLWYDAELKDPVSFAGLIKETAISRGATIIEHARASEVRRSPRGFAVHYLQGEHEAVANSRVVVNCAGPWIDSIAPLSGRVRQSRLWCKAFNLLFNKRLEGRYAISFRSSRGRLFFMVPREEGCAVGTQYLPYSGSPDGVSVSPEEVAEFFSEFRECVPEIGLELGDVLRAEVGVLPVRSFKGGTPELFGAGQILVDRGYIEILSTKYTTFLEQGRKALHAAAPFLEGALHANKL